ncbi:histone H1.4-like [Heterodontus francisci]|uniref:histone H1.4-like n=1 Tax=Heterodontus francisci TaxID=7792 RepID=UPI00355B4263
MTDTAAAEAAPPATDAQVKTRKKKKAAPRNKSAGPTLSKKILKIVADCTDRRGTSLPAIKKALGRSGVDVGKFRTQIKQRNQGKCGKESEVRSRQKTFSEESSRLESDQQEGGNTKEIPSEESSASEKVSCKEGQKSQECHGRKGAQESSNIKGQDQAESSKGSKSSLWNEVKLHGKVVDI